MARRIIVRNIEQTIAAQAQKVMSAKVNKAIEAEFIKAKKALLNDFDKHKVTVELSDDEPQIGTSNITKYGNLFSLLGVDEGTDVPEIIREVFETVVRIKRKAQFVKRAGKKFVFAVQIQYPTQSEINEATKILEWTSRGVVELIQDGTPGFGRYIYSLTTKFKNSRSGTAVQSKSKRVREGSFSGVPYTNEITERFVRRLSKI
jgi:hypothetical protein